MSEIIRGQEYDHREFARRQQLRRLSEARRRRKTAMEEMENRCDVETPNEIFWQDKDNFFTDLGDK